MRITPILCAVLLAACAAAPNSNSNGSGNGGSTDAGSTDAGPARDAGPGFDAGPDAGPVLEPDGGTCTYDAGPAGQLGCGNFVKCEQACASGDNCCEQACYTAATPTAQMLANTLDDCLNMACPDTDGGSCVTESSACTTCQAIAAFGSCMTQFSACNNN